MSFLTNKKIVFIDSSALAALFNQKDKNHQYAKKLFSELLKKNYYFVLTNFIIAETHSVVLSRTRNIRLAHKWLITAYSDFDIIRPKKEDEKQAVYQIQQFIDKDYSLTDMLSFLIMEKLRIKYYFAFDKHFKQFSRFTDIQDITSI